VPDRGEFPFGGRQCVGVDVDVAAAPASAKARAVARPMPELAPVTKATCPVKSYVGFTTSLFLWLRVVRR
jgi:hypothetical protein